jgi:hypothetical protein
MACYRDSFICFYFSNYAAPRCTLSSGFLSFSLIRSEYSTRNAVFKTLNIQGIHKRMVQFHKLLTNYFSSHTGTTYTVSSGKCPCFSCTASSSLLMLTAGPRDQFPRWRHCRGRLSVCSVLRCPDLWLRCSLGFEHGLKKTHHTRIYFLNRDYSVFITKYIYFSNFTYPVTCFLVPPKISLRTPRDTRNTGWRPLL